MISDPIDACRFHLHDTVAPHIFNDAQIQEFLDLERVPDSAGIRPAETGYVPTYNVLRAAGRGWIWLAGEAGNKPMQYKVGDIFVTLDRKYCNARARDLMGSSCATATRLDEPDYEEHREIYHDGDDPRHRS